MAQELIIERVISDLMCSSRCPVNNFTDVSFITVVYGVNVLWATEEFLSEIPQCGHWERLEEMMSTLIVSSSVIQS